ncbi:MAG: glycosyltransferase [Lachnospiraceae bacterium]|nr:glycosyltransferase [Lachnospiraceae bacterium]
MKNNVSVSVVTACYNSSATIRQTIESVLHQTVPCKEYFIIDGASTDDTVKIAEEYAEAFRNKGVRYCIVSEKDNGIYDAMNKGIAKATGTMVGLLNSDDWYEAETVETAISTYEREPFDMMYADLNMIRDEQVIGVKKARLRERYVTTRDWNHPTTFITRKMYEIYHYPCKNVYDDLDVLLKIRRDKRKVVVVNKVLANYRLGGASNKRSLKNAWYRMGIKYRIYRENGYSRLYLIEAVGMELGKYLLTK